MREGVGGDVGCGAVVAHMSVFGCVGVGVRSGLGAGAAQIDVLVCGSDGGKTGCGVTAPVVALSLPWWCS